MTMTDGKLQLDIVTPSRRALSIACDEMRAPGGAGGFGVRPQHTPFVTTLLPGELTYVAAGAEHHYAVGEGFIEVHDDHVIVLAELAEPADEIDLTAAKAGLAQAEARLKGLLPEDKMFEVERANVERAAAIVHVAGRRR
jgi:F-type H+-transporting ATPase subunit epsilon